MSLKYGFYNSVNGDRTYNAEDMSQLFDGIINDGVFQTVGGCFAVSPSLGMTVTIATGRAWFDSTWSYNNALYPITIPDAEHSLHRIDAIVLQINKDDAVRTNTFQIIKGTPAFSPEKPTLASNQHVLAYVSVAPNALEITAADIENVVGLAATPYVTSVLKVSDITYLYEQWEAQWHKWIAEQESEFTGFLDDEKQLVKDWFSEITYILDDNVAARLANEIAQLDLRVTAIENNPNSIKEVGAVIRSDSWNPHDARAVVGDPGATIDIDIFARKVNYVEGVYTFVFDGSVWTLDETTRFEDISEYGLTDVTTNNFTVTFIFDGYFSQRIAVEGVTEHSVGIIGIASTATIFQNRAFDDAQIRPESYGDGYIYVVAHGFTPTYANIPVSIIIM